MITSAANTRIQPADMEAAVEFSRVMKSLVSSSASEMFLDGLENKRQHILDIFAAASTLDKPAFVNSILEWSSISRRARKELLAISDSSDLHLALCILGDTKSDYLDRLSKASSIGDPSLPVAKLPPDLLWEVMHFLDPINVPLCTQWVFNFDTETGALALLVDEEYDLFGSDPDEGYRNIAFAVDYLGQALYAAGLNPFGGGIYSADCFLAMVYGIYMSTVLEMRMTKQFTKILPPLIDVGRRLLGLKGEGKCQ